MNGLLLICVLFSICSTAVGFVSQPQRMFRAAAQLMRSEASTEPVDDLQAIVKYDGIAVSGFMSKANDISEAFVFSKLFATTKWNRITTVTDDIKFARKRLVNPATVYSGLIDVVNFASLDDGMDKCVAGNEAWIAFNVSSAELPAMADLAAANGVKRAVFAVPVWGDEVGADVTFSETTEKLSKAGVDYTILKFSGEDVTRMGEAKFPFRIVRAAMPLPGTETGPVLSSDDLMRVIIEVVDLPKTFNKVYGIGPGSRVDSEILVYMKSQGWPERVQIGLMVGDIMEKIEVKYNEEIKALESKEPRKKPKKKLEDGAVNKFAGFQQI